MKTIWKQESGRSMVEMIGVLAIMGLVTAGAFVLIQSGLTSQKMARAADEVDVLASNARIMTAGSDYTCSLPATTATATTADGGKLAKAILKSTAVTPLGGTYAITRSDDTKCTSSVTTDTQFKIHLVGLSADDCVTMKSRAFSGGTTACSGTTLSITYKK